MKSQILSEAYQPKTRRKYLRKIHKLFEDGGEISNNLESIEKIIGNSQQQINDLFNKELQFHCDFTKNQNQKQKQENEQKPEKNTKIDYVKEFNALKDELKKANENNIHMNSFASFSKIQTENKKKILKNLENDLQNSKNNYEQTVNNCLEKISNGSISFKEHLKAYHEKQMELNDEIDNITLLINNVIESAKIEAIQNSEITELIHFGQRKKM